MRRFVIERHGAAATGSLPHAEGIEWSDGSGMIRLRDKSVAGCESVEAFLLDNNVTARWLDPPNENSEPVMGADGRVVDWTDGRTSEPAGKLPSERADEVLRELNENPAAREAIIAALQKRFGNDDPSVMDMKLAFELVGLRTAIDERLGRAPGEGTK